MKTILIPVEDHDLMPAVLETARLLARRFDSYMEGFAVQPGAADFVTVDPLNSFAMAPHAETSAEIERHARAMFESFMMANDVPPAPASPQPARFSQSWSRPAVEFDTFIGSYGRVFDLIVLGKPGRAPESPRMSPLQSALFESGRPALIVPAAPPRDLGRHVLIAWNGATEQARTNAFAMPLLRLAERVTVLAVEDGMTPGPGADAVARALVRDGVAATAVTVSRGARTTGEAVLDHATALGCDLLVKGAYTKSRLREMIFGDATRHILAHATLPILMAY